MCLVCPSNLALLLISPLGGQLEVFDRSRALLAVILVLFCCCVFVCICCTAKGDKMRANSVTTARHQGYGGSVRVENPQLVRQLSAEHSGDQGLGAESATKGSVPNLRLNELRTDKI